MSGVHRQIAAAAYEVLAPDEKEVFLPFYDALMASSEYPDVFADCSMTAEQKAAIDIGCRRGHLYKPA